ncbi:YihY/virulence factor BrkB family protein [Microbispora amethystogenes]|uniref:YihY/virulence factor BrkB family protein n=1 Tax=Microbispora amethystogenes TaxID=1427754 RepID=UPI00340FCF5B
MGRVWPPAGQWPAIIRRVREEASRERLSLLAAGIAFWGTLSIFPVLMVVVAVYGLVADPRQVAGQLASFTRPLPPDVARLLVSQLTNAVRAGHRGFGAPLALSLVALLWASSRAVQALVRAVDAVYGSRRDRGFLRTRLTALLLTVAAIAGTSVLLALVAAFPVVLGHLGLGAAARAAVSAGRWVMLVLLFGAGLALLYRYVPGARLEPGWRSVGWGLGLAIPALLLVSVGLSVFVSGFGRFDQTYGALGAVVVLMLWLYLSSLVVLFGAEINGAIERHAREANAARAPGRAPSAPETPSAPDAPGSPLDRP